MRKKNNAFYPDQPQQRYHQPPLQQSPPLNAFYYPQPPPPHLSSQPIQSIQPPQPPPYLSHHYSYPPPLPHSPHIAPIQQQPPLPQHQSSSSLTHINNNSDDLNSKVISSSSSSLSTHPEARRVFKKKEMYEYKAPWTVHGLDWSNKPGEKAFQLALGSFIEGHTTNKLQIVTLAELAHDDPYYHRQYSNSDFVKIAETDYCYPITKVLWGPYKGSSKDLLATTGDYLKIWEIVEEMDGGDYGGESNTIGSSRYSGLKHQKLVERESLRNDRGSFSAPLTSFDWNELDPTLVVTSSIDTTCAVWNIETKQLKNHLIAHEEEVYDVAFVTNSVDTFVSVGADVRLFDLRSLKRSIIIYEMPRQSSNHNQHLQQQSSSPPFLHLCFNKIEAYYLATFHMNSTKVIILDIRNSGTPVAELDHFDAVNCVNWSPNSSNSLCSGGDDCQILIWDIKNLSPTSIPDPTITKYHKDATEMSELNWSTRCPEWLAMAFGSTVKTLRV